MAVKFFFSTYTHFVTVERITYMLFQSDFNSIQRDAITSILFERLERRKKCHCYKFRDLIDRIKVRETFVKAARLT